MWKYNKAALQLAIHYEKGLGVKQDTEQAIKYYEIAASTGIEQALLKYARLPCERPIRYYSRS